MKNYSLLIVLCLLLAASCGKSGIDPAAPPAPTGAIGTIKVAGQDFNANTLSASNTGKALNITFKNANKETVSLSLTDRVAGTYAVKSSLPGGRVMAGEEARVVYIDKNGTTYQGKTGSVTLTVGADGKLAGSFTFTAENGQKQTVTVEGVAFAAIEVKPAGECKLVSWETNVTGPGVDKYKSTETMEYDAIGRIVRSAYRERQNDPLEVTIYEYDAQGRLSKRTYQHGNRPAETTVYEYDAQGRMTPKNLFDDNGNYTFDTQGRLIKQTYTALGTTTTNTYEYTNGLMSKYTGVSTGSNNTNTVYTFTYDTQGRVSGFVETYTSEGRLEYTLTSIIQYASQPGKVAGAGGMNTHNGLSDWILLHDFIRVFIPGGLSDLSLGKNLISKVVSTAIDATPDPGQPAQLTFTQEHTYKFNELGYVTEKTHTNTVVNEGTYVTRYNYECK